MFHATVESPVGELLLVGDGEALRGLYLPGGRRPAPEREGWVRNASAFTEVEVRLAEYFDCGRRTFDLPIALTGSPFQLRVWRAVQEIGYGETVSYGELADRIGRPGSARAVGAANAANPISIVVPCHRLVGSTGRLTGYSGGLEAKARLLELEAGGSIRPRNATIAS